MHKVMTGVTDDVPQWSPPLNSGNICRMEAMRSVIRSPQWSYGERAAETGLVGRAGEVEGLAAMEPR